MRSTAPPALPDVRGIGHVRTWLFDLDNTLYPAAIDLFAQIDVRMKQFIAAALDLPEDEAFRVQKQYYREFGTSLRGLMVRHNLPPEDFLSYVHDIDYSVLAPDGSLDAVLAKLPGEKLIYTNGSAGHAERVIERLGVGRHFSGIFDIAAADYEPKPSPEAFRRMLGALGIAPGHTAFFEDTLKNLAPAHRAGMVTVFLDAAEHPDRRTPGAFDDRSDLSACHYVCQDLFPWLEHAATILSDPRAVDMPA